MGPHRSQRRIHLILILNPNRKANYPYAQLAHWRRFDGSGDPS